MERTLLRAWSIAEALPADAPNAQDFSLSALQLATVPAVSGVLLLEARAAIRNGKGSAKIIALLLLGPVTIREGAALRLVINRIGPV
jgi:hypothetical protein